MRQPKKLEDIKSNCVAKRALEIALAGDHDIMLVGPLGAGKTTLREAFRDVRSYEMELCGCGAEPGVTRWCQCSEPLKARYLRRFIRRCAGVDMVVEVCEVPVKEMQSNMPGVNMDDVKLRVFHAVSFGEKHKDTTLDDAGMRIMEMAARRCSFTTGQYQACIRVARTIANLAGSERIQAKHVAEAVQYRGDVHIPRAIEARKAA